MYQQFVDYVTRLRAVDEDAFLMIAAFCLVAAAVVCGVCVHFIAAIYNRLMGKWAMAKRAKLTQDVREIIEDCLVEGLSEAIESKRINIEEARQLYARMAHFGLWGLHPKKFSPKITSEDLADLKERLKAKRVNGNGHAPTAKLPEPTTTTSLVDKMFDGLAADLN